MRSFHGLSAAAALAVALAASPSRAGVKLELGADYGWAYGGMFELMLGVNGAIARHVSVGGRFGGFITSSATLGAPIDLELRATVGGGRVYLGGLIGPWLAFDAGFPIRFHSAFEFGLNAGALSLGLELGYLHPSAIAGLRLAFRI